MTDDSDFDGCNSECRRAGKHTLRWGGCEHAPEPEPTVSMSKVYRDTDGHNSIGFDVYTVPQLAELIAPVLLAPEPGFALPYSEEYGQELAKEVAHAIVHRNDPKQSAAASSCPRTTPDNPPTCGSPIVDRPFRSHRNPEEQP